MPIRLNSTGGGAVTITAPYTASTYTLTAPTVTANLITDSANSITQSMMSTGLAGTGPAFSAYNSSGTSIPSGSETKIAFQTKEFDTNGCFDTSTYKFTPNVAGYYSMTYCVRFNSLTATSYFYPSLYKNASVYKYGNIWVTPSAGNYNLQFVNTVLAYANGTTDYFEVYVYQSTGYTFNTVSSAQNTYFQGHMVRSA